MTSFNQEFIGLNHADLGSVTANQHHAEAHTHNVGVRVYDGSVQSISNDTYTKVNYDTEDFDTDTMHDNATNNTRITFTTAGKYLVGAIVRWTGTAGADRRHRLLLNNTTVIAETRYALSLGSSDAANLCATIYDFSAADYVEVQVYQGTGGSLNINGEASSPFFTFRLDG